VRSLVQMDAPDHPKYRALTQQWFTNQNLRKLEERIRAIARAQVASMIERGGECDFVRDVAVMYPLHVIMEILGVPREDEQRMLMLTQQLFGSQDPELNRLAPGHPRHGGDGEAAAGRRRGFLRILSQAHRVAPRATARRCRDGDRECTDRRPADLRLGGDGLLHHHRCAGHDTTSSSTCGAMWALCEQAGELDKLRANPTLIPGWSKKRSAGPCRCSTSCARPWRLHAARRADRQGRLADAVLLSGNRDEEVFDAPFTFRSDRSPNKHISFGTGAHACLGQHLARLEMRILFEELIPKLKSVELTGEPRRSASTFVGGRRRCR
jgi:cytochrome P450